MIPRATYGFELNDKPNKFGEYKIYLRIIKDRKKSRRVTDICVKKDQWTDPSKFKGENWIKGRPDAAALNDRLFNLLKDAREKGDNVEVKTSENIANAIEQDLQEPEYVSFIDFAERVYQGMYDEGNIGQYKQYKHTIDKLKVFLKKKHKLDLSMKELSVSLVQDFDKFLRTINNERHPEERLHPNTIHSRHKTLRALIYRAVDEDLLPYGKNPYLKFKLKTVSTTKEKLDDSEIEALEQIELTPMSVKACSRDAFLFSYYCAGIRIGDLIQLRWCNISPERDRLAYVMGKTHKFKNIVLVPQAQKILERYWTDDKTPQSYIFPFFKEDMSFAKAVTQDEKDRMAVELKRDLARQKSSKEALINKELKEVAKMAGIEKTVSCHISRHSFAHKALGIETDKSIIKELLSHDSISTTERYMGSFESTVIDNSLNKIFDSNKTKETSREKLLNKIGNLTDKQILELLKKINE